ncbi:unnamed protein product [Brassica oleracea]|uniref:ABC transmembrane type-1 domain-containing protein n=1 Tax=Brassica oleracea TaxID=3712 RepID=A0A3P6EHC7_BRAOL|nr:unnamed protein product [Brassica oleracea]
MQNDREAKEDKKKMKKESVSLMGLFSAADKVDYILMFLGTFGTCVHGGTLPLFFVFFGKMLLTWQSFYGFYSHILHIPGLRSSCGRTRRFKSEARVCARFLWSAGEVEDGRINSGSGIFGGRSEIRFSGSGSDLVQSVHRLCLASLPLLVWLSSRCEGTGVESLNLRLFPLGTTCAYLLAYLPRFWTHKNALYLVYLGLVNLVSAWMGVACWMQTGERQTARLRIIYLKSILAKDITFFDTEARDSNFIFHISSDTILVQDAIGDKTGHVLRYLCQFIAGFVIGFLSVWQLTLLTLAVVPLIAIAGGGYAVIMSTISKKSEAAYADAGKVAEEVSIASYVRLHLHVKNVFTNKVPLA